MARYIALSFRQQGQRGPSEVPSFAMNAVSGARKVLSSVQIRPGQVFHTTAPNITGRTGPP